MAPYSYRILNTELEEIRLVRLKPGEGNDPICLDIFHSALKAPTRRLDPTRDTLIEIQKTLPQNFYVKETLDSRYIFGLKTKEITPSTWVHPTESFDHNRYELRKDDYLPGPGYEPAYEALSYTWASELPSATCSISDSSLNIEMELQGNLASALKHLRYKDKDRVLWIDAICINQKDKTERDLQVKRMGSIYSYAQTVVVWLGPEREGSTHALSTLQSLANEVEMTIDNSLLASPETTQPDWYHPFYPLPPTIFNDTTWSSLTSLFNRAWFSRVWVIQEVALANKFAVLYCGNFSLPWLDVRKAIGILHAKQSTPQDVRAVLDPHVPGIPPTAMRSLPRLLKTSRQRYCRFPHDKVYGILSIVSPDLSRLIEPKYEEPATRTFTNMSVAHLKLTARLELLQFCSITERYSGAPSWVPSWFSGPRTLLFGFRTGHFRQASGQSAAQYSKASDDTLQVAGVRCAQVESVGDGANGNIEEVFNTIRNWEPEGLRLDNYGPGGPMLDAFLEAVFQGCFKNRFPHAVSWPTMSELRDHYLGLLPGQHPGVIQKYLQNGVANGAKFFTTNQGYFGVAEQCVEIG